MQSKLADIDPIVRSARGGVRPGAGRKPVAPERRALREAISALDRAARELAHPGDVSLRLAAEMVAALAGTLRARLLTAGAARMIADSPAEREAASTIPGARPGGDPDPAPAGELPL